MNPVSHKKSWISDCNSKTHQETQWTRFRSHLFIEIVSIETHPKKQKRGFIFENRHSPCHADLIDVYKIGTMEKIALVATPIL